MQLDIFLPHLRTGGIEVGLVRLAPELNARGIRVRFVLQDGTGELRDCLPDDCECVALDAGGMWASARAYAALLQESPCDVVYSATNALNVAQLLANRMLGAAAPKAVVGEHIPLGAFLASRKRPWLRKFIMKTTYGRATAFVAPHPHIVAEHEDLLGRACPPGTVLPNPVVNTLVPHPEVPQRAQRFVALGRLSPEKGFDLALHVMAVYRIHDAEAHLTIYGDGDDRARLETLRDRLELQAHVTFAGRTNDVAGALTASDLFLCTSEVEGLGNAIIEAQAAGVPVLSVDCPFGPRLLLRDGRAGCLVETRDPDDIAATLHRFAGSPEVRRSAQAAGQEVAEAYTVSASADAHATFFERVLA